MSGHLWNLTHQNMIKRMREEPVANTVELYEFGIGPKVSFSDEDLLQEASDIFSWMYDEQVSQHIAVVEIDTPFHIRSTNNDDRDPHERMDKKHLMIIFLTVARVIIRLLKHTALRTITTSKITGAIHSGLIVK